MTGHLLYTEEYVKLVARMLHDPFDGSRDAGQIDFEARAILAALSSAGRLVPPGSEVREEWIVTGEPGDGYPAYEFTWSSPEYSDPEFSARHFVETVHRGSKWAVGPTLAHRRVITTPPSVPGTKEGT